MLAVEAAMRIFEGQCRLSHPAEAGQRLSHHHRPRASLGEPSQLVRATGERRYWIREKRLQVPQLCLEGLRTNNREPIVRRCRD